MSDVEALRSEARRLRQLIKDCDDSTELNRLWIAFYAIADQLFPEALEARREYRRLEGRARALAKAEYARLAESLWAASEEDLIPPVELDDLAEMSTLDLSERLEALRSECRATVGSDRREPLLHEIRRVREELESRPEEPSPEDEPPRTKICPHCAEEILAAAVKCRYCGESVAGGTRSSAEDGTGWEFQTVVKSVGIGLLLAVPVALCLLLIMLLVSSDSSDTVPQEVGFLLFAALVHFTIFGFFCSYVAKQKGRNDLTWFVLGGLFGLLALLAVGFTPSLKDSTS